MRQERYNSERDSTRFIIIASVLVLLSLTACSLPKNIDLRQPESRDYQFEKADKYALLLVSVHVKGKENCPEAKAVVFNHSVYTLDSVIASFERPQQIDGLPNDTWLHFKEIRPRLITLHKVLLDRTGNDRYRALLSDTIQAKPGKIYYIGELHANIIDCKHMSTTSKDEYDRDVQLLHKLVPSMRGRTIEKKILRDRL